MERGTRVSNTTLLIATASVILRSTCNVGNEL